MSIQAVLPATPGGVLVASPNLQVRDQVIRSLDRPGPVHIACGGAEALAKLENGQWQLLFLDRRLPDLDAEELVAIIEQRYPGIRVVMLDSTTDSRSTELVAGSAGGRDGKLCPLPHARSTPKDDPVPGLIGDSAAMRELYRLMRLVAPRNTTVMVTGPTGSGKDVVARAIHRLSRRAAAAFSVLNCAAIPETLVESELFGYVRGAFTGAAQNYGGRIVTAQGGTLFLDEIGELPLATQSKLLRFLEQKEIQRLGGAETIKVDVRVIAATNQDLAAAVERGHFREDLYFRLSAFPLRLVGLAERGDDILRLAFHFLGLQDANAGLQLDESAREKILAYHWPGNVRELQQALERAAILAGDSRVISAEHLTFVPPRRTAA